VQADLAPTAASVGSQSSLKPERFYTGLSTSHNAKLSLCLITNHHPMKQVVRAEVRLHAFLSYGLSNDTVKSNDRMMNDELRMVVV
jgi:hypothetical protein